MCVLDNSRKKLKHSFWLSRDIWNLTLYLKVFIYTHIYLKISCGTVVGKH